jgi:hypothetical protein
MNCENCDIEHTGEYGSGRFCSSKCARGFSTKAKRKEINAKISNTLTGTGNSDVSLQCKYCTKEFKVPYKKRHQKCCSLSCSRSLNYLNPIFRDKISKSLKKHYKDPKNRDRLRDIGRKGGFGTRGYTKYGVHFQSKLEKKCFELLEDLQIEFTPHKNIPKSSKVSDIYLIKSSIWIELDGIDREARKEWLGENYQYWLDKLQLYKDNNLNMKIFKTYEDFYNYIHNNILN